MDTNKTKDQTAMNGWVQNRYCQVLAIAKRANKLLQDSYEKGLPITELALVKTDAKKPVTIAVDEFKHGKIKAVLPQKANISFADNENKEETKSPEE